MGWVFNSFSFWMDTITSHKNTQVKTLTRHKYTSSGMLKVWFYALCFLATTSSSRLFVAPDSLVSFFPVSHWTPATRWETATKCAAVPRRIFYWCCSLSTLICLFFTHTRDRVRSSKAANLYCNCRQMLLFFLYASRLERMQPKGRSKPKSETQQMAHRTRTHTYTHTVRNVITIKAQHVV